MRCFNSNPRNEARLSQLSYPSKTEKKVLVELYVASLSLETKNDSLIDLSDKLGMDEEDLGKRLLSLQDKGLVESSDGNCLMTKRGREAITVVMVGGAFDIVHPGHLETLVKSKALGDALVVSVARDVTFERNKHRKPLHEEELRRRLVLALKPVDAAVLGSKSDIFETVAFLKPDIIALGYDQSHSDARIAEEARMRGVQVKVVRLDSSMPSIKSTKILAQGRDILREI